MNWQTTVNNHGEQPEKSKIVSVFQFINDCVPSNVNITASCGCTSTLWNPNSKQLKVTLSAGKVPKHLKNSYQISKYVKMTYICDGISITDKLMIKATIVKNVVI